MFEVLESAAELVVRREPIDVLRKPEHLQYAQHRGHARGRIPGLEFGQRLLGHADPLGDDGLGQPPAQPGRAESLAQGLQLAIASRERRWGLLRHG